MKRTRVYSIRGFLNNEEPIHIEGDYSDLTKVLTKGIVITVLATNAAHLMFGAHVTYAATATISRTFDAKLWPYFIDIGIPITKVMMALGVYKVIRGDDKGWKTVQRAGLGLVCLYLIDGAIHILAGVGHDLETA